MSRVMRSLRTGLFGISRRSSSFDRLGFPSGPPVERQHLEQVVAMFMKGYHAALTWEVTPALFAELESVDSEFQGFAYEGAAMSLALFDCLTPWRRDRIEGFLADGAMSHEYMVHVGMGFALARLRKRVEPTMRELHPLYRWLVLDGYGFHEGFFAWRRSYLDQLIPARLTGYSRRVFDQGLGRSLWFVAGTLLSKIEEIIGSFSRERRADLWSGIGLACAYAGGVDRRALEAVRSAAGEYRAHAAQGVAFAAKARQRAGNLVPLTTVASDVFWGRAAEAAAKVTDDALIGLPRDGDEPAFEVWRRRIRESN